MTAILEREEIIEKDQDQSTINPVAREWKASAFWRELHDDAHPTDKGKGFGNFVKQEWHASGYFNTKKKQAKDLYPIH